jgi:LPS sulfotransferase NodH
MKFEITKFPVLIVSAPRCGSTALIEKIARDYGLVEFSEPNQYPRSLWKLKYDFIRQQRTDFVVKIMPHILNRSQFIDPEKFFVISLSRKNIIDQCVSYYTAKQTSIWHRKQNTAEEFHVGINQEIIYRAVQEIKFFQSMIENLQINIDLRLYYEDLELDDVSIIKNPVPGNIDEIKNAIIQEYYNGEDSVSGKHICL